MTQTTPQLGDYEGLVFTTARMFASQVKMDEEDLRQELRIRVWRACETYDPRKTRVALGNYVYGCIANKVKDYKRNAARRAEYGVEFEYIEDRLGLSENPTTEAFEGEHMSVGRDEVYGRIDEGLLTLPATITSGEADVLVLLMFDMSEREIMLRLALARVELRVVEQALRDKLADWDPGGGATQVVALAVAA